jgi:FtsZ-binding cell division protein ZapB
MSEETLDKDEMIASLMESVENLREEIKQTRNNNRILRRVHSALRQGMTALQKQRLNWPNRMMSCSRFCNGDFDAKVTSPVEGGLPDTGTQVEATV